VRLQGVGHHCQHARREAQAEVGFAHFDVAHLWRPGVDAGLPGDDAVALGGRGRHRHAQRRVEARGDFGLHRSQTVPLRAVTAVRSLLGETTFAFEDREAAVRAAAMFGHRACGFSGCLVVIKQGLLDCGSTATFDRRMRKLPSVKVLWGAMSTRSPRRALVVQRFVVPRLDASS
jgi:hypothetical protein